jgi:rhodanese-related sulfurtransferase
MADIATISRDELKQKLDRKDNFYLVEALAADHFQAAHLPGAVNIPYDRVRELAPQVLSDKNPEIVTYCAAAT